MTNSVLVRFNHNILGDVVLYDCSERISPEFSRDKPNDIPQERYLLSMKGYAYPPSLTGLFPGTKINVCTPLFDGVLLLVNAGADGRVQVETNGKYVIKLAGD